MTPGAVAELVVRMADENPTWGYTRVRGALANLGHHIARNTVKRILHDHGIAPAPERNQRTPWKTFLQAPLTPRTLRRRRWRSCSRERQPRFRSSMSRSCWAPRP